MCSLYIIEVFYCYLILYVQLPVLWEYNRKSMINLVASVVKVLCIQTPLSYFGIMSVNIEVILSLS